MELEQIAKLSFDELKKEWDEHIEPLPKQKKEELNEQAYSYCYDREFFKSHNLNYLKINGLDISKLTLYAYYRTYYVSLSHTKRREQDSNL